MGREGDGAGMSICRPTHWMLFPRKYDGVNGRHLCLRLGLRTFSADDHARAGGVADVSVAVLAAQPVLVIDSGYELPLRLVGASAGILEHVQSLLSVVGAGHLSVVVVEIFQWGKPVKCLTIVPLVSM